jgi:ubiquinone/menaquinone biosynthesis C-methylase UbiE
MHRVCDDQRVPRAEGASTFQTPAAAYDRHVGRYGPQLAEGLIAAADVRPAWRVLDVGCGPGALTAALVAKGARSVAAIDPSEPFVKACRKRVPEAEVRVGSAEELPYGDAEFDATLSQLVINFLGDAPGAVREMARVTRPGGVVAGCVWDYAEGMTMLRCFWNAAARLDPQAAPLDEGGRMRYCQPEELRELWEEAGLTDVELGPLAVSADYSDFDDFWEPFPVGVGPSGAYCASLAPADQEALRRGCHRELGSPQGRFRLDARAWFAVGKPSR